MSQTKLLRTFSRHVVSFIIVVFVECQPCETNHLNGSYCRVSAVLHRGQTHLYCREDIIKWVMEIYNLVYRHNKYVWLSFLHLSFQQPNLKISTAKIQLCCVSLNIRIQNSSTITLRPRQNLRHFADDIFKCVSLNGYLLISITVWLKFVPKGPNTNIPSLVQIIAWRRPGDKPLSEPVMVKLLTHICVTRPQGAMRLNSLWHILHMVDDIRFTIPILRWWPGQWRRQGIVTSNTFHEVCSQTWRLITHGN